MIISISAGKGGWDDYVMGWGQYVLAGTKSKPRDTSKVHHLDGDIHLGNKICQATSYKENYYRIVLSFKGKMKLDVLHDVYEEFKTLFMTGFEDDEYHMNAVIHKDTDNDHIHVRIPKLNLRTGTQLQLYMDSVDRDRINIIRDHLDLKYNLESPLDAKKKLLFSSKKKYFNTWRMEHGQTIKLSTKKGREKLQASLDKYVCDLHEAGLINSYSDLLEVIVQLDLSIINDGYDKGKDFHYITVSNETGKQRIKGDIYGKYFWEYKQENRREYIRDNTSIRNFKKTIEKRDSDTIQSSLRKELERRNTKVKSRYKFAREKAKDEFQQFRNNLSKQHQQGQKDDLSLNRDYHTNDTIGYPGSQTDNGQPRAAGILYKREKVDFTRRNENKRKLQTNPKKERLDGVQSYRRTYQRIRREREERQQARGKNRKSLLERDREDRTSLYERINKNRGNYIDGLRAKRFIQHGFIRQWIYEIAQRQRNKIEDIRKQSIEFTTGIQQFIKDIQTVVDRRRVYRKYIEEVSRTIKPVYENHQNSSEQRHLSISR